MYVLVFYKYKEDPVKMKALECSQHFPHYNPMGVFRCHGNQSSNPVIFMFESVNRRTDRHTGDGSTPIL